MSSALYPAAVWGRFASPSHVLAGEASNGEKATTRLIARAQTPASAEVAELHADRAGRWFWRAHAGPWLAAALEVLCELGDNSPTKDIPMAELESALAGLQIPAARRYCAVMVRELLQQANPR